MLATIFTFAIEPPVLLTFVIDPATVPILLDPFRSAATVFIFVVAADCAIVAILLWIFATAVISALIPDAVVMSELIAPRLVI